MGSREVISAIQRSAGSMGAQKVPEVHQDYVFHMVVARGAKSQVATKVLRAALHIAKLMEEGNGVKS